MKIFICYAREDETGARRLHTDLTVAGLHPWLDKVDILGGMDWERECQHAMRESDVILLLASNTSVNKVGVVQQEIRQAIKLAERDPPGYVRIIPVKLTPCELQFDQLKVLHTENLYPNWKDGVALLVRAIKFAQNQNFRMQSGIDPVVAKSAHLLAPNLYSPAKVVTGVVKYTRSSVPAPLVLEILVTVERGYVIRNEQGVLEANLVMRPGTQSLQKMGEQLGLGNVRLTSISSMLSSDRRSPTVFEGGVITLLPKGIEAPSMHSLGEKVVLPITMMMDARMRVEGYLEGTTYKGTLRVVATTSVPGVGVSLEGTVEIELE